jgi:hypothetical protein
VCLSCLFQRLKPFLSWVNHLFHCFHSFKKLLLLPLVCVCECKYTTFCCNCNSLL